MANWFSKLFIGTAIAGAVNNSAAAEYPVQDKKSAPTETVTINNAEIRIFKKINTINMDTPLPRSWNGGGHNNEQNAHYDHNYKRVVCETYSISDDIAYKRATHIDNDGKQSRPPHISVEKALAEFNQILSGSGYKGKLPTSLDDTQKLLSEPIPGLNNKKMNFVQETASRSGLTAAIEFKQKIERVNQENTSVKTVTHEIEHGSTAKTKEKSTLPSTLLAPQDYWLFNMADEINSFYKESPDKDISQTINEFNNIHKDTYMQYYFDAINQDGSLWNSETYRHAYAQNMTIKNHPQIVETSQIIFGEGVSATFEGKEYPLAKCIRESDKSWCYTLMQDDKRTDKLPDGAILTDANGRKYEANTLFSDKTNRPLKDENGNKISASGYWDGDNGWSVKISKLRPQAKADFSDNNFEKLITEKFGEKSADNKLRNAIEAQLAQYKQENFYQSLSGLSTLSTIDAAYVAECKATPLTDDYVKSGQKFQNDNRSNNLSQLVDITAQFNSANDGRFDLAEHISYIRDAKAERNGEKTQEVSSQEGSREINNFMQVYQQQNRQKQ